ncbi:MAG: hypothetical protein JWL58_6736 [Streptosporangiaceae bacterium]|nr:hypothetical protein [Streptosporangiaceae bacterium]
MTVKAAGMSDTAVRVDKPSEVPALRRSEAMLTR